MKRYTTAQIRNVALIGGTNTGKTLLAEAMLLEGKVIDRKGTIEAGTTVSDYNEIEQQNKKSVYSTVMYTEFMDHKLNIFDTPGSDDFIGAVITSLSVADIAVMVLNAQQGVDVGTEIFSRWVKRLDRPMLFALNQLDHEKANYDQTLETLHQSFGNKVVTVQYPVNPGANFDTFIDVLLMKMYRFKGTNGEREELEIPADQLEKAKELNAKLTEAAAENDEGLMELFFEKGMLTEDEIRAGLAKGIATQGVYPVFCLSGLKNIGVKRLMEFIIKVGPSPADSPMLNDDKGNLIPCDAKAPTSLFIFKTAVEPHIGEINYFKVTSGILTENQDLLNVNTDTKERLSQLFIVAGKNRTKVTELEAGDIGAAVKLKNTKTTHTLCDESRVFKFPPFQFPNSKFRTAVKAVNEAETEKMGELLNRAHQADLTINVEFSSAGRVSTTSTRSNGNSPTSTSCRWNSSPRESPTAKP